MLDTHAAVRPTLVRAIALLLLVAFALAVSYHPASAARPGPASPIISARTASAALMVDVIEGSSFAPAPIANALVVVHNALGTDDEVTYGYTDPNGQVDFKLAPGSYVVSIRAEGRVSQMSDTFTLAANQSHTVTFVLNPAQ